MLLHIYVNQRQHLRILLVQESSQMEPIAFGIDFCKPRSIVNFFKHYFSEYDKISEQLCRMNDTQENIELSARIVSFILSMIALSANKFNLIIYPCDLLLLISRFRDSGGNCKYIYRKYTICLCFRSRAIQLTFDLWNQQQLQI
jgi:hypothetical protein